MKARKESGVKYPTLYVPEAEAAADAKKMVSLMLISSTN